MIENESNVAGRQLMEDQIRAWMQVDKRLKSLAFYLKNIRQDAYDKACFYPSYALDEIGYRFGYDSPERFVINLVDEETRVKKKIQKLKAVNEAFIDYINELPPVEKNHAKDKYVYEKTSSFYDYERRWYKKGLELEYWFSDIKEDSQRVDFEGVEEEKRFTQSVIDRVDNNYWMPVKQRNLLTELFSTSANS